MTKTMEAKAPRWVAHCTAGLAAVVMTLAACLVQATEAPRDPYEHFFHTTFGNFPEELAEARKLGKRGILIFFEMTIARSAIA